MQSSTPWKRSDASALIVRSRLCPSCMPGGGRVCGRGLLPAGASCTVVAAGSPSPPWQSTTQTASAGRTGATRSPGGCFARSCRAVPKTSACQTAWSETYEYLRNSRFRKSAHRARRRRHRTGAAGTRGPRTRRSGCAARGSGRARRPARGPSPGRAAPCPRQSAARVRRENPRRLCGAGAAAAARPTDPNSAGRREARTASGRGG